MFRAFCLWIAASLVTAPLLYGAMKLAHPAVRTHGEDLVQDYLSARAWLRGEDPYQDLVQMRAENGFPPTLPDPVPSNPHPPLAFLLVLPFTMDFDRDYELFTYVNIFALALAWNGAWAMFGRLKWYTVLAGGVLGFWAPVYQGLDFGQPSGLLPLGGLGFWWLARRTSGLPLGFALGLLCCIRPFYFLLSAAGATKPRAFGLAVIGFLAGFALPFAVVGTSPWTWWAHNASESSAYANICGTLAGVLRLGSLGGMALSGLAWTALLWLRQRRDVDTVIALAIAGILWLYPLAWYHYDTIAVPLIVWMICEGVKREDRLALWMLIGYVLLRWLPSTQELYMQRMYMQFAGRTLLVLGLAKLAWVHEGEPHRST